MQNLKHIILKLSIPLQKFIQRLGYIESSFTEELVNHLYEIARPGDFLGSYETGRFTSWFIKGNYDHSAMVTDKKEVVEAVGDHFVNGKNLGGVRIIPFKEWVWKKSQVYIARNKNPMVAIKASSAYYTMVGMGYDYFFTRGNKKMYCTEVPYICHHSFQPDFLSSVPDDKEILPIDYLSSTDIELIHDTRRTKFPA
jgi:hypothetical protein